MKESGALKNVAASARARLLLISRSSGRDFNTLLIRYGIERILYRLSISGHKHRFILKGAQLFTVWHPVPHRVTRDLDLLGFGGCSPEELEKVFREICGQKVPDDGVVFDGNSVRVEQLRTEEIYSGVRVSFLGRMGNARIPVQVDVGFGDNLAVNAQEITFPGLLDMPQAILRAYCMETVLAEKLQAVLALGMLNSRMKDYYDFWFLGSRFSFDGSRLRASILATCRQRATTIPNGVPTGLSKEFSGNSSRQALWLAFWRKSVDVVPVVSLEQVVDFSASFLIPPALAAAQDRPFESAWTAGGPWILENKI